MKRIYKTITALTFHVINLIWFRQQLQLQLRRLPPVREKITIGFRGVEQSWAALGEFAVQLSANVTLNTPKRRKRFNWRGAVADCRQRYPPGYRVPRAAREICMYGEPESYLISALVYLKSDCQMAELTVWKTLKPKPKPKLKHRLKLRPAMVNWVRQCTGSCWLKCARRSRSRTSWQLFSACSSAF